MSLKRYFQKEKIVSHQPITTWYKTILPTTEELNSLRTNLENSNQSGTTIRLFSFTMDKMKEGTSIDNPTEDLANSGKIAEICKTTSVLSGTQDQTSRATTGETRNSQTIDTRTTKEDKTQTIKQSTHWLTNLSLELNRRQ